MHHTMQQPQQPKRGRGQPSPIHDPAMRARHINLNAQIRTIRARQRQRTAALTSLTTALERTRANAQQDPNNPRNDAKEADYLARMAEEERQRLASLDEQLSRLRGRRAALDAAISKMQRKPGKE